jgi:hypothetical protein
VTVVGRAELIAETAKLVELSRILSQPWVNGARDYFVRIRTDKVTGRRLGPAPDNRPRS